MIHSACLTFQMAIHPATEEGRDATERARVPARMAAEERAEQQSEGVRPVPSSASGKYWNRIYCIQELFKIEYVILKKFYERNAL